MSNSDNPFSSPTVVAPEEPPKAKRGLAHIVRRGKTKSSKEQAKGSGGAHLVARNVHPEFSDDSIDALITSPALKTPTKPEPDPRGAGAMGKSGQMGSYQTGTVDDFTVEEARPEPHKALVPQVQAQETEVAPPEDPTRGFVLVSAGNDQGRRVGLLEGRTTIGRGLDCDIVLTDPSVSRKHAYVERRENVYVVCDMSSGNGTFVNERERDGEVLIVNNDSFRIGNTVVTFQGPEAQDEAAATTNWRAQQSTGGLGKKKGRSRQRTSDEESTVAGKGLVRPPTELSDDPATEASTDVVSSVEVTPQKVTNRRKPTVPPPIPDSKKSVQDKALQALSSIVNTPTPSDPVINQTGLGELPNATVPPTPSPAIPYPVNQPSSNPYPQRAPQANNMGPPGQGGAPMQRASPPMPMRHGSNGQLPMPMGPGQMPIQPGTPPVSGPYASPQGAYMPQGSGQMMQRPMLAGAGPNMMRPGYGPGQAPPRQNGKLLIGFISVTLVLVVVGLVATIMGQMDSESADNSAIGPDGGAEMAGAPLASDGATAVEPVSKADAAAGDVVASADPVKNADAAPVASTDVNKSTDAGAAAVATTDPTTDPATDPDEPRLVASLIANNTQLPVSTWGTDESFLKGIPDIKPTVEPIEAVEPVTPDEPVVEDPPDDPDPPKVEDKPPRNNKPRNNKPRNNKPRNNKPRNNKPRNNKPRNNGDDDDDDDDDDPPRVSSSDVSAAKSAAKAMYKRKDFEEAADRLTDAADSADEKTEDKLLDIAAGYRQVGSLLASAEKEQSRNPASALKDYKKALAKDKRIGGSAHTRLLRLRIGQVAPRAAKSYMAKGQLAEAKKAADDASRYDQEDAVEAVYNSLERKAKSLIKKALKAKRKDPSEAKRLLREATKIAPKDTDAYEDAREELKDF